MVAPSHIERETEANVELLSRINPRLIPSELAPLFPAYKELLLLYQNYGLWSSVLNLARTIQAYGQQDRVVVMMSGVSAGGKDTLREEVE